MIGGYFYRSVDREVDAGLRRLLASSCRRMDVWDEGYFFFDDAFGSERQPCTVSADFAALSDDLLVAPDSPTGYRELQLEPDFRTRFSREGAGAFNAIQNDCRMAVALNTGGARNLLLASHRAGSGRIYYHTLASGILFASDLRFLLAIVPFEVSPLGIYSLLKYGLIPEPQTISRNILAVPPAHYLKYDVSSGAASAHPYFRFRFADESGPMAAGGEGALEPARKALRESAGFLRRYPSAMLLSGGIDSSLYGCYLGQARKEPLDGFYCAFGEDDPEYPFARVAAERIGANLQVATMAKPDALRALDEVVRLTDHPFSDFSSLPIVFLLKFIRGRWTRKGVVVECNGGDDCFGFPDLQNEAKFRAKHLVPPWLKKSVSLWFRSSPYWKWEACEGAVARVAALADVHELTPLNYFLVLAPVNYLAMDVPADWDETLQGLIERTCSNCGEDYPRLSFKAKTTIRQLFYVNSARWAAKALSVGESLGLRVVYPYIWLDVLLEQGRLPWTAKVRDGVVKWPLKKLLEEFMPADFVYRKKSGFVPPLVRWLTDREFNHRVREILTRNDGFVRQILPRRVLDELLADALSGKRLRFPVLNMLWGAIFAESWIQEYRRSR